MSQSMSQDRESSALIHWNKQLRRDRKQPISPFAATAILGTSPSKSATSSHCVALLLSNSTQGLTIPTAWPGRGMSWHHWPVAYEDKSDGMAAAVWREEGHLFLIHLWKCEVHDIVSRQVWCAYMTLIGIHGKAGEIVEIVENMFKKGTWNIM